MTLFLNIFPRFLQDILVRPEQPIEKSKIHWKYLFYSKKTKKKRFFLKIGKKWRKSYHGSTENVLKGHSDREKNIASTKGNITITLFQNKCSLFILKPQPYSKKISNWEIKNLLIIAHFIGIKPSKTKIFLKIRKN